MRRYIILVGVVFVFFASAIFLAINKKHRTVEDEVSQSVEASELFEEFTSNENNANEKYLDKVLEITGAVSEVLTNQNGESIILLKTKDPLYGVSCTMQKNTVPIPADTHITIKGICTGYLSDVIVTRGVLIIN